MSKPTTTPAPAPARATRGAVHIRSYAGAAGTPDRHDYAQFVLPLSGVLLLDVEGRTGRLDAGRGAVVAPGAWHAQAGAADNRNLIVDIDVHLDVDAGRAAAGVLPAAAERLFERPFHPIGEATRKLVEFMAVLAGRGAPAPALLDGWLPLLVDTLALEAPRPASRLAALKARVELDPGAPWSTESMALAAGVGVSRLHALFRASLDTSPHAWLLDVRMARVRAWLAAGDSPVADIALRAGFSDQSALTRAMRRATGMTPAAYRRACRQERGDDGRPAQENRPKPA